MSGTTKIFPGQVSVTDMARDLLDIVGPDRVAEVRTISLPGIGFEVPDDVAVEYARRQAGEPGGETRPDVPVPASKKRGRPPKSTGGAT